MELSWSHCSSTQSLARHHGSRLRASGDGLVGPSPPNCSAEAGQADGCRAISRRWRHSSGPRATGTSFADERRQDARHQRGCGAQVLDRGGEQRGLVTKRAEAVVATRAKQATNGTRAVVVIRGKIQLPGRLAADRAPSILALQHQGVIGERKPVKLFAELPSLPAGLTCATLAVAGLPVHVRVLGRILVPRGTVGPVLALRSHDPNLRTRRSRCNRCQGGPEALVPCYCDGAGTPKPRYS